MEAIRGMVEADSTEVQVAGYLKTVEQAFKLGESQARLMDFGILD